jgi:hypothetical protein
LGTGVGEGEDADHGGRDGRAEFAARRGGRGRG